MTKTTKMRIWRKSPRLSLFTSLYSTPLHAIVKRMAVWRVSSPNIVIDKLLDGLMLPYFTKQPRITDVTDSSIRRTS